MGKNRCGGSSSIHCQYSSVLLTKPAPVSASITHRRGSMCGRSRLLLRLQLIPETVEIGRATQWLPDTKSGDQWTFGLGAPILDFSLNDTLEDGFIDNAKRVLEFWLDVDQKNLLRVKAGMYSFTMPDYYETNTTNFRGWASQEIIDVPTEKLSCSKGHLDELLSWLSRQLTRKGDITGATLGAMVRRHLGSDDPGAMTLQNLINAAVGKDNYVFAGVDELRRLIDEKIKSKGGSTVDAPDR